MSPTDTESAEAQTVDSIVQPTYHLMGYIDDMHRSTRRLQNQTTMVWSDRPDTARVDIDFVYVEGNVSAISASFQLLDLKDVRENLTSCADFTNIYDYLKRVQFQTD